MSSGRKDTQPQSRHRTRRAAARIVAAGFAASVAIGLSPATAQAAPPPPNPSDSSISAAQAAKDAAAAQVGAISAQLAGAQAGVDAAQAASAIALDDYQAKQAAYETAKQASDAAAAVAQKATDDLHASQQDLADFARTSYIEGSTYSGAASLLTSGGPAQLIERAALLDAAGSNRSTVLDRFTVQQHAATAADAAAKAALGTADGLKAEAADALAGAQDSERAARAAAAALASQQSTLQAQLNTAQQTLLGLEGARRANEQYAAQQAAAARQQARDQEAAAAAAKKAASSSSSSSTRTTTSGGPSAAPPTVSVVADAGVGSASAVQAAISAGMQYLGTPYAWGGGGTRGPGPGIAPDEGVVGFDCSGLTQYSYARAGISIPRNSRSQYAALPKVSRSDLSAGDLVFWATDPGDPTTIYHVALYLGNGKVLQAPQSGDVVKVSTMWWSGYAGAVRPSA